MNDNILTVNKKLVLIRLIPFLIAFLIMASIVIYTRSSLLLECESLFGINLNYLNLILLTHMLPYFIFVISIWASFVGYKELKFKYSPPLNTPVFHKGVIAKTGTKVKIKAYIKLASPIYCIYLLYLGNTAYSQMLENSTYSEYINKIEKQCINQVRTDI